MDITEGTVTLSKSEAKCLATYASADEMRPQLAGVVVEPELLRCWATDGHRAVMARKVGGHYLGRCPAVVVPRDSFETVVRMCRKATDSVVVFVGPPQGADDGGSRSLAAGERVVGMQAVGADGAVRGSHHVTVLDVKPVPIDQVLYVPEQPSAPGAPVVGINADLLADVRLIARAAEKGGVALHPGADALAPVGFRVTADSETEWTAVVMPMRVDDAPDVSAADAVNWAAGRVRKACGKPAASALLAAFRNPPAAAELPTPPATPETKPPKSTRRRRGAGKAKAKANAS
jgi:hypothetical protein